MPDPFASYPEFPREYLNEVADEMCARFDIPPAEAVGRLRRVFDQWDFVGDSDAENHLGHELPSYWANTVYYGYNSDWDRDPPPADLTPLPWPSGD